MFSKRFYIPCFSSSQCTLLSCLFFFFFPLFGWFFFVAPPLSTVLISSFLNASLGGFSPWKRWTASDWYSVPLLAWEREAAGGGVIQWEKETHAVAGSVYSAAGLSDMTGINDVFGLFLKTIFTRKSSLLDARRFAKTHCRTNTTPRKQREWLQPVPHFTPLAGEMKGALLFHLSFAPTHFLSPHTNNTGKKKKSSSFDEMPHVLTLFTRTRVMAAFRSAFFAATRNLILRIVSGKTPVVPPRHIAVFSLYSIPLVFWDKTRFMPLIYIPTQHTCSWFVRPVASAVWGNPALPFDQYGSNIYCSWKGQGEPISKIQPRLITTTWHATTCMFSLCHHSRCYFKQLLLFSKDISIRISSLSPHSIQAVNELGLKSPKSP